MTSPSGAAKAVAQQLGGLAAPQIASAPPGDSGFAVPQTAFSAGTDSSFTGNPFTPAQLAQLSSSVGNGDQPPAFLVAIYEAAGKRYGIPWEILAAINAIETDYGRNLSVSSAGAIGWMQFMPDTWKQYGVAARGNHEPNPYDPWDAIFTAARYLAANGGSQDLPRAIFAYNHATWYVDAVLWRAKMLIDASYPVSVGTGSPPASQYIESGQLTAGFLRIDQHVGAGHPVAVIAMLAAAKALSALNLPYSQAVQSSGPLAGWRQDCSGFVSYLLNQYGGQTFGDATTDQYPGLMPFGRGTHVTVWTIPQTGNQGHTIIEILGQWFESGGMSSGGPHQMTTADAAQELGVSSLAQLGDAPTPRGFYPQHPLGH